MNKFKNIMERSRSIHRFMEVERMTQNDIYELYYECYTAYEAIFTERIRYGSHLRRIVTEYKHIPEFRVLKPSQISHIIFRSRKMAYWFAFAFWKTIDTQVANGNIDRAELQLSLTFYPHIPTANIMEEILNEKVSASQSPDLLLSERQANEIATETRPVRV